MKEGLWFHFVWKEHCQKFEENCKQRNDGCQYTSGVSVDNIVGLILDSATEETLLANELMSSDEEFEINRAMAGEISAG